MKLEKLSDYKRGYVAGRFHPHLIWSDLEVGIQSYKSGEKHKAHYHLLCDEINIIVDGKCQFTFIDPIGEGLYQYSMQPLEKNDILTVERDEIVAFEALTDCTLVVIKTNSNPNDKYEI
jgi:mannose-6-phosphate isomerase-like protein (cupin superfamily)